MKKPKTKINKKTVLLYETQNGGKESYQPKHLQKVHVEIVANTLPND